MKIVVEVYCGKCETSLGPQQMDNNNTVWVNPEARTKSATYSCSQCGQETIVTMWVDESNATVVPSEHASAALSEKTSELPSRTSQQLPPEEVKPD